jgi:nicotinamide mononucleotide transporter
MPDFLNINTIAFTLFDYPMSYVELVGTIFYLWSVWLIARRNILTWPIGIISVILFMFLFYQIQLYSDTIEQGYYLLASVYGWWFWRKTAQQQKTDEKLNVSYSPPRVILFWVGIIAVLSVIVGVAMTQIHVWLPAIFPVAADYPFLDALTTVMSFVAMWLMARKHTESWVYWIIVDVIGIGLYFVKDVRFLSLLYVVLLIMAINGLWTWHKASPPFSWTPKLKQEAA